MDLSAHLINSIFTTRWLRRIRNGQVCGCPSTRTFVQPGSTALVNRVPASFTSVSVKPIVLNQNFHFGSWIGLSISPPKVLVPRNAAFSPGAFFCLCQAPIPPRRKNRKSGSCLFSDRKSVVEG